MKRRFLPLLLALLLLLTGCKPGDVKFYNSFYGLDQFMTIQLWGSGTTDIAKDLSKMIRSLEDVYDPLSETPAKGQTLLLQARTLSHRTGGAYSPTLYALKEVWGLPTLEYKTPTQDQIDQALSEERQDLTDLLPGYAADKCVEYLSGQPVDRGYLELGTTVMTYGHKPDGTPWSVSIHSPWGTGPVGTVSVTGTTAVSTAGSYQYWFELDGQRRFPILDPATGRPADAGLATVSVICQSGTTAQGLAHALFVMGLEDGTRLWQRSRDFEAVFILSDGTIHATEGAHFTGAPCTLISRPEK